jgi:hypothetical protein
MGKLKDQVEQILSINNRDIRYYICFADYFNATKFEKGWHIKQLNNKYYYFNDYFSLCNPYLLDCSSDEFLKILAFIDNNKTMALLNIRTYNKWYLVDMIIQEMLKGNEVYLERVT